MRFKQKFARTCSCCGNGMNDGYIIFDEYACSKDCADKVAIKAGYDSYTDAFNSNANHNDDPEIGIEPGDDVYYTEWDETDIED